MYFLNNKLLGSKKKKRKEVIKFVGRKKKDDSGYQTRYPRLRRLRANALRYEDIRDLTIRQRRRP